MALSFRNQAHFEWNNIENVVHANPGDLRLCINFTCFSRTPSRTIYFFFLHEKQIRLDSASILMPNLKIVQSSMSSTSSSAMPSTYDHHHQGAQHQHQSSSSSSSSSSPQQQHHHKIYQLCACSNGKLFLAMSHSICAGDESTVCR